MTSKELFQDAINLKKTPRPPIWIMRQAGRYLPEYRALKEKHSFTEIVKTPELSLEAALQPMRRFDLDCSILFSDILVVSEALGLPYYFKDVGGIALERTIKTSKDVENLPSADCICEKLNYVEKALKLLRNALPQKAVLGFCASPFTLAAYMIEGSSSKTFSKYLSFIDENPKAFELLMNRLESATITYAQMQADCGIDAFQIFDSHAGLTPKNLYQKYSGRYISNIAKSLKGKTKTILFANSMTSRFDEVIDANADAYSLDSSVKLSQIRKNFVGKFALQGNLSPQLVSESTPEICAQQTREIVEDMQGLGGHIFNLGHGILPDARLENVEAIVNTVKNF